MKLIVEQEENMRLDKYLSIHTEYSRSLIQKMIQNGSILLDGNPTTCHTIVKTGDVIFIQDFQNSSKMEKEIIPLDIVFEDENVLLINKPSGMVVHPGNGNRHGTLANAILGYTDHYSNRNGEERPGIVHRIDKDTSGLILIAKNNLSHEILADDFKYKRIERKYIALVKGRLPHKNIVIDAPIGRDPKNRLKMAVTDKNSKHAVTHVHVLKYYLHYTLVECVLETGRTHQIRVHLASIGYPLFNDPLYGKEEIPSFGQFLHSSEITFQEPITKENLHFKVDLPKEFQDYLYTLEEDEEELIHKKNSGES